MEDFFGGGGAVGVGGHHNVDAFEWVGGFGASRVVVADGFCLLCAAHFADGGGDVAAAVEVEGEYRKSCAWGKISSLTYHHKSVVATPTNLTIIPEKSHIFQQKISPIPRLFHLKML